jgi:hypothetical protein
MDTPQLAPALGNYAGPDRCWGRERDIREIADYLLRGTSVLVAGPRRIGKTSIVHSVLAALAPARSVFLDVEHLGDPTEMFAALAAAASADAGTWARIRARFGKRLNDTVNRVEAVDFGVLKVDLHAAMSGSWRDDARAVIEALADDDRPVFVAVDELPLLVDRIMKRDPAEAELLMSTLRALASDYPDVRWLISGSIGLDAVLHRAGLTGLITHLRSYVVDGWDEDTTTTAVEALAAWNRLDLGPGAARAVFARLGLGVPYHVQLLMDEVRRDAVRRDRRVSAGDVIRVYESPRMTSALSAHLLHLESRLGKVLGEGDALRLAQELLTQAAVAGGVTTNDAASLAAETVEDDASRATTLREVLEILEHDAYVARDESGWRFRSRLVAEWWKRRYEAGFIPIGERTPSS